MPKYTGRRLIIINSSFVSGIFLHFDNKNNWKKASWLASLEINVFYCLLGLLLFENRLWKTYECPVSLSVCLSALSLCRDLSVCCSTNICIPLIRSEGKGGQEDAINSSVLQLCAVITFCWSCTTYTSVNGKIMSTIWWIFLLLNHLITSSTPVLYTGMLVLKTLHILKSCKKNLRQIKLN